MHHTTHQQYSEGDKHCQSDLKKTVTLTRTTVARIKMRTEGITSGRLYLPVALLLRIIMQTAIIKRLVAIPNVKFVLSGSAGAQRCSPYATLAMRLANRNEGILAGGDMLILHVYSV